MGPDGLALARRLYLQIGELGDALEQYVRIGGFPAALHDYAAQGEPRLQTIALVWTMVANEIRIARLDPAAALKLIERVGVSLGSPLSWQAAAQSMDVASPHTARAYVHALAESFALLVIYYWNVEGGFEPRKQRKVYFLDPLFSAAPAAVVGARQRAAQDGLLEGVVASALFRSASEHLVQADPSLGALGYWRSREGREIDFVVETGGFGTGSRLPVEVKGDSRSGVASAVASIRRAFGRGMVISRTRLERHGDVLVVPAAVLLAGLTERTERRLTTL
jgi:predicted AAA+ superfamily ATPase